MGIYNLPKAEQDRYNNDQIDYKAFWEKTQSQKLKRTNKIIMPTLTETLNLYVTRFKNNLDELDSQATQEHMYGPRGPWHVHKRAQNCFICDYSTMIHQLFDIIIDLQVLLPPKLVKRLAFASTKEGSQRLALLP